MLWFVPSLFLHMNSVPAGKPVGCLNAWPRGPALRHVVAAWPEPLSLLTAAKAQ